VEDGLPSLEEAASLLVAASVIEVETDRGDRLELWTISHEGAAVSASGPRFAVGRGMQLRYQARTDSGPLLVHAVIEEAEYRSAARAAITVRVTDVVHETGRQRGSERLVLATSATLRALRCDRIVPDELLAGTLVDLSETGCGVTTADSRCESATDYGCPPASSKARSPPNSESPASRPSATP
jgi:hypothetical protein